MKITDLQIERFGVWRGLSLALSSSGLSVFYGPNEAGKTTLMRFVRGVLYGFDPPGDALQNGPSGANAMSDANRVGRASACEGLLRVDHQQRLCEIRRAAHQENRGLVSVTGLPQEGEADELLSQLLAETPRELFDAVFAIGLHELQELATLESDEVAEHVYGMTLGPDGRRLLEAAERIEQERRRFFGPNHRTGELATLLHQFDAATAQLDSLENVRDRHAKLCEQRVRVQKEIAGLKSRQAGIQSQLRGHLFLERIWTPWSRTREYRAELQKLPVVLGFPEDGLVRLDELEEQIASLTTCRDTLLAEAAQFRKSADDLRIDAELQKHAATVQSFIDQRGWVMELTEKITTAQEQVHGLKQELDKRLVTLGPEWSLARLEAADTSPAANFRMVNLGRHYQSALQRRTKLKRRLQRLRNRCHERTAELDDRRKSLGGRSLEEALFLARKQLTDLEDLGHIRLREVELEQRRIGINDQLNRLEERLTLPIWVYVVLGFFGVSGLIFAILGIVTGVTTSGIAGAMYSLLGTTCGGLAWALKMHFEGETRETVERLHDEARENEIRLRETRSVISRLTAGLAGAACGPRPTTRLAGAACGPRPVASNTLADNTQIVSTTFENTPGPQSAPAKPATHMSEADLIRQAARRIAELEQLAAAQQRIHNTRRRLSELRSRFQGFQREVSTARQNWCEALLQSGFSETVRTGEAFEAWQRVVEAHDQRRQWKSASAELQAAQRAWQSFRQRLEELGHRIQCWDLDYGKPLDVLSAWEEELKVLGRNQAQRRQLRRDEKTRQREAAEYQARIDDLKMQRAALLVQAGAGSRDEFEQRAKWLDRRAELEELLAGAQAELETASKIEPNLTIVEEDLLAFRPEENSQCIQTLNRELEDLEAELQLAFEQLGGLKQEIQALESDRRATKLRFEREQIAGKLKQSTEQWFALQLADRLVERIRTRFERTCQPDTLVAASHFLRQLTGDKYRSLWTPLGQRHLCIDDEHGQTLRVEQLSGGTREQLFLAIRLAMVRQFAAKGIELPMVLDDVIVNFDQLRTEAAVDTLIEFAEQGQQILLFTCHLHLAHLFESKGIEPIWLPNRAATVEERRAG